MENVVNDINSLNNIIEAIKILIPNLGWFFYSITGLMAFIPKPKENSIAVNLYNAANLLACNFGKAANKE